MYKALSVTSVATLITTIQLNVSVMQDSSCIFCSIISGKLPGYKVYEDDKVVAILDKYPISPGHTLVMPKEHFENYLESPDDLLAYTAIAAKRIAKAIKEELRADGVRILTNVGASAGQVIFHLHIHIIPTWSEGFPQEFSDFVPRREQPKEYYESLSKRLSEKIKS